MSWPPPVNVSETERVKYFGRQAGPIYGMYLRRCLLLSLFALSTIPALTAASTGFQGKWELDKKAPQVAGAPEDLQCEIKQDNSKVVIKSKYVEPRNAVYPLLWVGIMTYELELPVDGSAKVTHIGPFAHNAKTRIEGNKMITEFTAANGAEGGGKVEGQWIRTLSDDGKQMTLQVLTNASDGRKLDQTLVFKRK